MLHLWEAQVKRNGLRAVRLAISVALEAFLPPTLGIPFLHTTPDRLKWDGGRFVTAGQSVVMVTPLLVAPLLTHCMHRLMYCGVMIAR